MLPTIVFAGLIALAILVIDPAALLIAAPFLITWIMAPWLADWISRPTVRAVSPPTPAEERILRTLARRTWLFYENFVGPQDNWLPPDHFQESPRGVVAHRTSPTNIGLYLLSALTAFDFGYIQAENLVLRLGFAFDTLDQLQRYRGHFLNWIDTGNLQPLPPPYVSTVDSGNLAAALIVLQQGCLEVRQQGVWRPQRWQGLLDTIALVADTIERLSRDGNRRSAAVRALDDCVEEIEAETRAALREPSSAALALARLTGPRREDLNQCLMALVADEESPIDADTLTAIRLYVSRLHQHLDGMQREWENYLPWLPLLAAPPAALSAGDSPDPLRRAWQELLQALPANPVWSELDATLREARRKLERVCSLLAEPSAMETDAMQESLAWCDALADALARAQRNATTLLSDLAQLADRARSFVDAMDFGFLYDPDLALFHIGYNVNTGELDNSYYDLLASEARIASLLAIGKHDVPVKHWLHLARPLTTLGNSQQALLSWSGTMFEYLMPPLLLRTYPDTQFEQTYASVIDHQIDYGREKAIPWGISESGFYAFDAALNYQYHAFGVPGLGLRRGLGDDLVVTPYASLLALPFRPRSVLEQSAAFRTDGR